MSEKFGGVVLAPTLAIKSMLAAETSPPLAFKVATLKASGGDVSAASMDFIANVGASTTPPNFSLMPTDPMVYPLIIALLAIILLPLWGPQDDA